MGKLSIRARLTLVTLAIMVVMAGILTATAIYSSARIYGNVGAPVEGAGDAVEVEVVPAGEGFSEVTATEGYSVEEAAEQFQWLSLVLMASVLAAGGIAAWFVLGAALRPIGRLTRQVEAVTAHGLDAQITGFQAGDELNRLADAFNGMLRRLNRAFAAQKQFSAAAAHELKTPLAAIKTNIEVLDVGGAASQAEYQTVFAAVLRQTDRMSHLVDDLFSLSASEGYALDEQINLGDLLRDIVREQAGKPIVPTLAPGPDIVAPGNAAMLHRALSNLVENAVKYNRPGGGVEISARREGHWAVVTVADTGIGIAPEHLPHIFEPFYRADPSRSRSIGGAGLGLAIARDTARRHGGELTAQSQPGVGTQFVLRVPVG